MRRNHHIDKPQKELFRDSPITWISTFVKLSDSPPAFCLPGWFNDLEISFFFEYKQIQWN